MRMPGMFDRTRPDAEAVRRVKALVTAHVGLPESVTLTVAELRCHEPNCPPIETVIATHETNGHARDWRIAKPINDITAEDVALLDVKS